MTVLTATKPNQSVSSEQVSKLVAQATLGDKGSFEELYQLYADKIYLLCLRMTSRRDLAEDHMQEAFIKAWLALDKFKGKSQFSTWLYRIAVNVVLGHQRKYQYEVLADQNWLQEFEDTLMTSHNQQQIDLEKAIARLPMQAKNLIVLHDLAGMTHKEIGQSLNIATGTCKAHLSRARALLRDMLSCD